MRLKKIKFFFLKKRLSQIGLIFKTYDPGYENEWPHRRQTQKQHEAKFLIIQIKKTKQIAIKRMMIKSGIKIKWNKTMKDEIEK
jgi:hypothetical protein